mgnify:CR=1 FL=1
MRLNYVWLSVLVYGAARQADATSCASPPWDDQSFGPLDVEEMMVAVDAHPWRSESCYGGQPAELKNCSLVDEETADEIAAVATASGTQFCDTPYEDLPENADRRFLRRFVPAQPLTAGHVYALACDGASQGTVHVRNDAGPAAPATALEIVDPYYTRDGNGCCGWGDAIEFHLGDPDVAFLQDGGYIEARYADGRQYVIVPSLRGDALSLRPTRETIALTPVSATGLRGETVEIDGGEIDGDLVYNPCAIATRTHPAALWLLAPFLWIAAHGRRRRRAV